MKIIPFFFCFFYCLTGFAQKAKPVIAFCPPCLIDELSFPTIQAGIEFPLSKRLSFYNEVGIKYRKGYYEDNDSMFVGSKGIKLKTELRYHLFKTKRFLKNAYVALNGFYNYQTYNTSVAYFYQKDSVNELVDRFGLKKAVYGINVLLGLNRTIRGRFVFNPFAGVGLRFVNTKSVNKEFNGDRDSLHQPIDLTVAGIRSWEDANGKASDVLNITLGLRICYKL